MSGEDALRVFVPSRFGFKGSGWGALVDEFVYEDKGTEPSICSESVTGVECHQDSNQAWQRQRTKCFFAPAENASMFPKPCKTFTVVS